MRKLVIAFVVGMSLIFSIAGITIAGASASAPVHGCVQLDHHTDYSCISPEGFNYGWLLAEANFDYQHPQHGNNMTVGEVYFKDSSVGLVHPSPRSHHRLVAAADGEVPVNWNPGINELHPKPPVTCTTWFGTDAGTRFPCSARAQASIEDQWYQMAEWYPGNSW